MKNRNNSHEEQCMFAAVWSKYPTLSKKSVSPHVQTIQLPFPSNITQAYGYELKQGIPQVSKIAFAKVNPKASKS
jgi:hypothetical protein